MRMPDYFIGISSFRGVLYGIWRRSDYAVLMF